MTEATVREAFGQQAEWCARLGSPLTALLMDQAARHLDRSTPVGRRILDWPGAPSARFDAVPLRLAGALHALVRAGQAPALAACYPPNPQPDGDALWTAVAATLRDADAALQPWLDSAPQTNEVTRSAILMAGLMVVAGETGLPVALYELGSSAGLNLVLDRYRYRVGTVETGPEDAALRLEPEWQGPSPPLVRLHVVSRRGADLNPLDVTNPGDVARLLAYVWADQGQRQARIRTAIGIAAVDPPPLDRADAADWTERMLHPAGTPGVVRVLMHSITFQYFPAATQARIRSHLDRVGALATPDAPLAWLRFEADPATAQSPALQLTTWPGGTTRTLARGSPHGHWVAWH